MRLFHVISIHIDRLSRCGKGVMGDDILLHRRLKAYATSAHRSVHECRGGSLWILDPSNTSSTTSIAGSTLIGSSARYVYTTMWPSAVSSNMKISAQHTRKRRVHILNRPAFGARLLFPMPIQGVAADGRDTMQGPKGGICAHSGKIIRRPSAGCVGRTPLYYSVHIRNICA